MESIELATFKIDLSSLNETLDKVRKEFYESGLSINDFFAKKFSEDIEKSLKNLDDLHKMSMDFKQMDGIFNKLKNANP